MTMERVAGMMNPAPTPIAGGRRSAGGSLAKLATIGATEHHEAELQRALAAEAVTEGTGRKQHTGEDEARASMNHCSFGAARPRARSGSSGGRRFSELTDRRSSPG